MARNIGLANIYVKIRNKRALTIDDLVFLSIFDPECFKKTCSNLLYNLPEAKVLMEKKKDEEENNAKQVKSEKTGDAQEKVQTQDKKESQQAQEQQEQQEQQEGRSMFVSQCRLEQEKVDALLENLKKMEWEEEVIREVDAEKVKNLLGNLYMEMLFPHNESVKYFCLEDHVECSLFNKKV